MVHRTACIAALTLTGCLSTPGPAQAPIDAAPDDGDARDGATADAGDPCAIVREPPPAQVCDPTASLTARPFPGGDFRLRNQLARDVNGDGTDDLVLASDVAGRRGVFVLLGPQDPAALTYHAFVPTTIDPQALAVANVTGPAGGCPELIIAGHNDAGTIGYVMSYEYVGGDNLFAAAPVQAEIGFVPPSAGVPVMVTTAAIASPAGRDLVVADLYDLSVLVTDGDVGANLDSASAVRVLRSGPPWADINAVIPVPSPGACADRDDVIAVQNRSAVRLHNTGAGIEELNFAELADVVVHGVGRADLDGIPPDDLIGGAAGSAFGAYLLQYGAGDVLEIGTLPLDKSVPALGASFWFDGMVVADLGGSPAPELVLSDSPDGDVTADGALWLVDGLRMGEASIESATPQQLTFSDGFKPAQLVSADLDDDGTREVWVLTTGGEARCYQRQPSPPALRLCD